MFGSCCCWPEMKLDFEGEKSPALPKIPLSGNEIGIRWERNWENFNGKKSQIKVFLGRVKEGNGEGRGIKMEQNSGNVGDSQLDLSNPTAAQGWEIPKSPGFAGYKPWKSRKNGRGKALGKRVFPKNAAFPAFIPPCG